MTDVARPGEIELTAGPAAAVEEQPAAEETAAEAVVETEQTAEQEATVEQPAAAAAVKPAATTVPVGELIAERTARKNIERTLKQFEPLLQRLTPELQQAILEGRALTAPPVNTREVESQRLTQVAEKFGLFKTDADGNQVPDLDTAKRVDAGIRDVVREEVAPLRQESASDKATQNLRTALTFAEANGYDVDTVRETYEDVLRQPNGAAMLADPNVAKTVWFQALGRMTAAGKAPAPKPAAAAPAAAVKPPVIPAEGGRRAPGQAAVRLSPQIQKVYKDNGIDPTKSYSSRADLSNPASISLED